MAILTYPLNGIDYQAEDAERYLCTRTSGVFSAEDNFKIEAIGGMQVTIGKGLAWVKNSEFAGKSIANTDTVTLTVPLADGTKKRIDRVVLKFDKAANRSEILVKPGVASNTPTAPNVDRTELVYELGLYTIAVGAAVTEITPSDITSTLLDESVCGLMRDGVTGIPTTQLQEQVVDLLADLRKSFKSQLTAQGNEFDAWFEEIKGQLSTDVAGNLQNQIDDLGEVVEGIAGGLPYFAGKGESITVRSAANRIENVTSHGFTEQAGAGDASPTNVRPITVGARKRVEVEVNGSESGWRVTGQGANTIFVCDNTLTHNTGTPTTILSSRYKYANIQGSNTLQGISGYDATLYIRDSRFDRVGSFKEHLKENPLKIWYTPSDESHATGIYTPVIAEGAEYRCECIKLQQHLCDGDIVDSNVPSGCDKSAVFDGSPDEAWGMQASGANTLFYLQGALIGNSETAVDALSNLYPNTGVWSGNTVEGFSGYNESLYVRDFRYPTVEDFKAALAANPLFVAYRSTEYTTEKDEKACIERHVRRCMVVDGATVMFEQGTEGYKVTLKNAQSGAVKCNRFKSLTVASGAVTIPASQFPAEVTNLQQANEWAKTNNVQLEYALASPAIYAQPAVDLPADPITTVTQATLEEPAADTPTPLAVQGETGTYTVSGEKTVSVYLKPMQDGGDAATLGGKPPEYFLPADQPAVGAAKSSKPTFAVNYGRIVSIDNQGMYIRNADSEGSGVFIGVREGFQTLSPDMNTSGTPVNLGGPSYRWRTLYLQNQPDVSSDGNLKEQVAPLSEKQMLFFDSLNPVQYKLKGGSHDRLHYGFIAQEVEQAMAAVGISDMEFGGFCKDNKIKTVKRYSEQGELLGETEESMDGYEYSLRYGEFIALNTAAIQALKKEVIELKAQMDKLKGV